MALGRRTLQQQVQPVPVASKSVSVRFLAFTHVDNLAEILDQILVIVKILVSSKFFIRWTVSNVGLGVHVRAVEALPQVLLEASLTWKVHLDCFCHEAS